jgi:hypothetical protein
MRKSASNSSFYDRGADLLRRHTVDGHPLATVRLAADEANGRAWNVAEPGEELDERLVRGTIDRRGRDSNEERVVARAGDPGLPGAGDDANVELDTGWCGPDHTDVVSRRGADDADVESRR